MEVDKLNQSLAERRTLIDEADVKLVALIAERLVLADEVGVIKKLLGLPSLDRAREDAVKERIARIAFTLGVDVETIVEVFKLILAETHERRKRAPKEVDVG